MECGYGAQVSAICDDSFDRLKEIETEPVLIVTDNGEISGELLEKGYSMRNGFDQKMPPEGCAEIR